MNVTAGAEGCSGTFFLIQLPHNYLLREATSSAIAVWQPATAVLAWFRIAVLFG